MNDAVDKVIEIANAVAPDSVAVEATQAIVKTLDDPSILNIVADLELAYKLIFEFREKIDGLHPTVGNLIKALF